MIHCFPVRALPFPVILSRLRFLWLLALTFLLAGPPGVRADDPLLLRGPYLQRAAPTELTICWRTDEPGTGRVRYGTAAGALTGTAEGVVDAINHEVRLTGLTPASHYYYSIETGDTLLATGPEFHFHTPPADGADVPVRFWVLGDAGTANLYQKMVRDAFAPLHARQRADLWLMLGDNAYYTGTDEQYQNALFNIYPDYLRQVPLWSCIGNHETYAGQDPQGNYTHDRVFVFPANGECGGVASGTERYYSWNYGRVHFISLDSMTVSREPDGPMAQWLKADLEANLQPWVVAFWHHPPYSMGSHNSDYEHELVEMRSKIVPVLEEHGVDLVMCGHSHNYERTYLLDGHYGLSTTLAPEHRKGPGSGRPDSDGAYYKEGLGMTPRQGAVYVTAGSSGQVSGGSLDHPAHFIALNKLGSLVVDVSGNRMDVKFLREASSPGADPVFDDYFSIIKGEPPPPVPLLTRGPYLQKASADALTVCWRTQDAASGQVRFGTSPGVFTGSAAEEGALRTGHAVRLTGLTPNTKYYYAIESGGIPLARGPDYCFTTGPAPGQGTPVRVWVLGNSGTRSDDQTQVRDAFTAVHAEKPADVWLMLGNNAHDAAGDAEYQVDVFETYQPWLRQVPLWSCPGERDLAGPAQDGQWAWDRIFDFPAAGECGGVPSGTERYYSWNHGNIHFVALDSVSSGRQAGDAMAMWLRADLDANTLPWTVAFWHHPPYSKGSADSDTVVQSREMREHILPVLEENGVDLVLSGHSQSYERSFLLDGHYGLANSLLPEQKPGPGDGREDGQGVYVKAAAGPAPHEGTVYVVAGSSGGIGGGPLNHPAHFLSLNLPGSVVIDVTGLRMDVRFLKESPGGGGNPVYEDYFTIVKGGPAPPLAPTGLAALALSQTAALVRWTDNSATEERVEFFSGTEEAELSSLGVLPPDTAGFTVQNLVAGRTYFFRTGVSNLAGTAYSTVLRYVHSPAAGTYSPIERWRFTHWGQTSGEGERADLTDPDEDGAVNLLEYALGTSPRSNDSLPVLTPGTGAEGRLTLAFDRQALPELSYAVEFTGDPALGPWEQGFLSAGGANTAGTVTAVDIAPVPAERRFARLRVTLAGPP